MGITFVDDEPTAAAPKRKITFEEPEKAAEPEKPRNALSPEMDALARKEAADMAARRYDSGGILPRATMDVMKNAGSFGIGQKASGLMEAEILGGRGREFGEVRDQYLMDEARQRSSLGSGADIIGSILSPSAVTGGGGFLANVLEGAIGSGVQEASTQLPSEADIIDVAKESAIGGGITAGLSGLGRGLAWGADKNAPNVGGLSQKALKGKKISEAADIARSELGVLDNPGLAGSEFKRSFRGEVEELSGSGKTDINKATGGDLTFSIQEPRSYVDPKTGQTVNVKDIGPGRTIQKAVKGQEYQNIRKAKGLDAIPISKEGTPSAFRLTEIADSLASKDNITLKEVDELRTQIRGLRSSALNATDKSAVEDMEQAIENSLQGMVSSGRITGDPAQWSLYKVGREKMSRVFDLKDNTSLKTVLLDESIPGSSIADSFFRLDSPAKRRKASKSIADVAKGLGKDSESLKTLQAGMLSDMFTSKDPATIMKKLKVLEEDPELITTLFDKETADKLTEMAMSLGNLDETELTSKATKDYVGMGFDILAQTVLGDNKLGKAVSGAAKGINARPSTRMSIATGAVTGGNPLAMGAAAITGEALHQLSKKPVRLALGRAAQKAAPGIARYTTQNSELEEYVPDYMMQRDATIQALEK